MLVGERTDALRHETNFLRADGEVARTGPEERAAAGDDVPEVKGLEGGVGVFAHFVHLNEVLHVARKVADGAEGGLAHDALQHHAARAGNLRRELLEFLGAHFAVLLAQVAEEVGAHEVVGIGHARFTQVRELRAAFGDDVVLLGCGFLRRLDFIFSHLNFLLKGLMCLV